VPLPPYLVPAPPQAIAAAAPARSGGRGWQVAIAIILIAVFVIAAAGTGAFVANASLSSQYSPQRALSDFFKAQAVGDVDGMLSNATFLRGDGAYDQFFNKDALTQMLSLAQNRDVSNVKVTSSQVVDSATSVVTVSMTWAGNRRTHAYTVRKDTARVHDYFYYSWRVDIPSASISVTLPNQGGNIEVDSLSLPTGASQSAIQVIEGYHTVTMQSTPFYDRASQVAPAVDANPSITFGGTLSEGAVAQASIAVKAAFPNCNAGVYYDCPGHLYHAPNNPGYIYYLTLPGYPEIDYTTYEYTVSGDPSTGMKLVVLVEPSKMSASGTCAYRLTVNGSQHYNFKGTWTATLTWSGGGFGADVIGDCETSKA
jgi:hypothetical protein